MSTNKLVSMVIVNYNSGDFLRRCLDSVAEQTYPNWEVIVVDNDSRDGSLEATEGFERLTVVRNDENRGFAAAQNQGLRNARGEYLMPLNFDIRMTPTFLRELVNGLASDCRVGSVCGKLLQMTPEWEPTDRIDTTGLSMSPSYVPTSRGHGEQDTGQFDTDVKVFGAQGAAPLYRGEMLEDVQFDGQYFDESYFMWYEDVDLDWRARLRGWKCRYVPTAVAYHLGHPASERRNPWYVATTIRNRWLMLLSNAPGEDLRRKWPALLAHELSLFHHVMRSRRFGAYCAAIKGLLARLHYVREKRAHVQSRAVHPARRLLG